MCDVYRKVEFAGKVHDESAKEQSEGANPAINNAIDWR